MVILRPSTCPVSIRLDASRVTGAWPSPFYCISSGWLLQLGAKLPRKYAILGSCFDCSHHLPPGIYLFQPSQGFAEDIHDILRLLQSNADTNQVGINSKAGCPVKLLIVG